MTITIRNIDEEDEHVKKRKNVMEKNITTKIIHTVMMSMKLLNKMMTFTSLLVIRLVVCRLELAGMRQKMMV